MRKKKPRFPAYTTMIGEGTQVSGDIRFTGGLHIDGKVTGDIIGLSDEGCGLSLGQSGVIAGNLDVAYVIIDGSVTGDVRASQRAELASGAKIQGTLCYGALKMGEGAEVNGKILRVDGGESSPLESHGARREEAESADASSRDDELGETVASPEEGAGPHRDSHDDRGNT